MTQILLCILLSFSALSATDVLKFKIVQGKFHAGGSASAQVISTDTEKRTMLAQLDYVVIKKRAVPVPSEYLKGTEKQELPLEFIDERGYLNLEAKGPMELEDAVVHHLGRVAVGKLLNGHHVKIVAKNGKSETEIFFHPQIPELGWGKVRLTLHTPIPFLRNYTLEAVLID